MRQGAESLVGRTVLLAELEIDFKYVDQPFAGQSTKGRPSILLQYLLDFPSDCRRVAFRVRGPFGGYAIQLIFGVLKRDVGVEAGAGGRNHVTRDFLQVSLRTVLPPHVKKDRLNI